MVSRSLFLRTRLTRALKLPEVRVATIEEEKVAPVEAAAAVVAVVAEERAVIDPLVRIDLPVRIDLLVRVATDLLVNVARDLLVKIADHTLKVVTDPIVRIADLALREVTDPRVIEEEVATEVASEVDVAVLSSSLIMKAVLMLDLPAPKVKFSVETVVDSVAREERVVSVEAVVDSAVREEMISEVAAVASEAATLPDLTMDITLREVVKEEVVKVLALPEVLLLPRLSDESCS